jgi:hypothetical protein
VRERAEAIVAGQRQVAELLVPARPPSVASVEDPAEEEPDDDLDEASDPDGEPSDADEPFNESITRTHAQQLIAYLRKTQHVSGPRTDLVYLESVDPTTGSTRRSRSSCNTRH